MRVRKKIIIISKFYSFRKSRAGLRLCLYKFLLLCVLDYNANAQVKWDGEALDGQWSSAANWVGDKVPDSLDDVILDNEFFTTSYTIYFPGNDSSVNLRSLSIVPAASMEIALIIPRANVAAPALNLSSPGYALAIMKGGRFINASGASSGTVIQFQDSVFIGNGGRYVHQTQRSHANLVTFLSRAPFTEEGEFELRIPSASSTIALSDRVFGKLILSADSTHLLVHYTAASTRPIQVRSDLTIGQGVRLKLNCSDTLYVKGDLVLSGSEMDMATTNRSLTLRLDGDLITDTGSVLTKSGTGSAMLLFNGNNIQSIKALGQCRSGISMMVNNGWGLRLQQPWELNSAIQLVEGKIITDSINILVINEEGKLLFDSLKVNTFIDGPLIIKSISTQEQTLFPVGRAGVLHWAALHNWSGIARAEYINQDPHILTNTQDGIDHFSTQGYWKFKIDSLIGNPMIELSFNDAQSSGVTDMGSLTIARLQQQTWTNAGVTGFKGSAGANGSVTSLGIPWQPGWEKFTFASMDNAQNPLPIDTSRHRYYTSNRLLNHAVQVKKVSRYGTEIRLEVYSERKESLRLVMVNALGQILYTKDHAIDRGINFIYCYSNSLPIGIIHIFGLFSNNKTNTVSVW